MIIAVASGKGGTGKTTVATSLALSLSRQGETISFLDCDVEAPNAHLFLHPEIRRTKDVNILIPEVNADLCTGSGRCAEVCEFHAVVVLGGKTLVFPELCHGCGSCTLVCPEAAITKIPKTLGILEQGTTGTWIDFAHGLLNVGEPMAVPVVESVRGADYVLLVTEPTPFGLHDLRLAAELTQELDIPAGVVINRDGFGDALVDEFCQQAGLPILMRIPLERQIGEGIAQGVNLIEIRPEYEHRFRQMAAQIESLVAEGLVV